MKIVMRRNSSGFTLIELMIVVVVIAILASLAYPSFISQIRAGRRADAISLISQIQQAQERHRSNNLTYSGNLTTLGVNGTGSYYTFAVSGESATGYTITATPIAGTSQTGDSGCQPLTLVLNAGAVTYGPSNGCWKR